jgi:ribosome-binding protein aMBF1 (putative translation factor)
MGDILKKCFVCGTETTKENSVLNKEVNLQVCKNCSGTPFEKEKVFELLDSLADGLVCGCI